MTTILIYFYRKKSSVTFSARMHFAHPSSHCLFSSASILARLWFCSPVFLPSLDLSSSLQVAQILCQLRALVPRRFRWYNHHGPSCLLLPRCCVLLLDYYISTKAPMPHHHKALHPHPMVCCTKGESPGSHATTGLICKREVNASIRCQLDMLCSHHHPTPWLVLVK